MLLALETFFPWKFFARFDSVCRKTKQLPKNVSCKMGYCRTRTKPPDVRLFKLSAFLKQIMRIQAFGMDNHLSRGNKRLTHSGSAAGAAGAVSPHTNSASKSNGGEVELQGKSEQTDVALTPQHENKLPESVISSVLSVQLQTAGVVLGK